MEQKSKFDKVMGTKDVLVIGFGAMIGWGWVVNSGDWITTAGFMGSVLAFLIGGWILLGVVFYFYSKKKYGADFGQDIIIKLDENLKE